MKVRVTRKNHVIEDERLTYVDTKFMGLPHAPKRCQMFYSIILLLIAATIAQSTDDPIIKYLTSSVSDQQIFDRMVGVDYQCPKCDVNQCPKSNEVCEHGLVPDPCGCCNLGVCRLTEGDRCLGQENMSTSILNFYGVCGKNLRCEVHNELRYSEELESICTCIDERQVCGTNNQSYSNICLLEKEAIEKRKEIHVLRYGPCNSVPLIISPPVDTRKPLRSELSLDCEAQGFPIPHITWEFQSENGQRKSLPGDDSMVVVLVRGGPEPNMVTSWVQISSVRQSDAGIYTCVASNSEGVKKKEARISFEQFV